MEGSTTLMVLKIDPVDLFANAQPFKIKILPPRDSVNRRANVVFPDPGSP